MTARQVVRGMIVSLIIILVCACKPQPAAGRAPTATACEVRSSVMRTDDGLFPYVEAPQILRTANRVILVGSPAFAVDSAGKPLHAPGETNATILAGVIIEGTRITVLRAPTNESFMNTPRAAIAPDGSLNLVWMSSSRLSGVSSMSDSVIWSRWSNSEWSTPARIPNAPTLVSWNPAKVSPMAYHDGRPFFLATPGLDAPRDARQIEWTPGGWVSRPFMGTPFGYPSLLSDGDIQVVAFTSYAAPDGNVLFTRTSTSGGRSWEQPVRVSERGSGEVHLPRILAMGGGKIGLVWLARTPTAARILMAISEDRGHTWVMKPGIDLSSDVSSLQAVAIDTGIVFVAFESSAAGRHRPALARWSGTQWEMIWLPAASPSLGTISLGMSDPRTVMVLWGAAPSGTQRFPRTILARVGTTCDLR